MVSALVNDGRRRRHNDESATIAAIARLFPAVPRPIVAVAVALFAPASVHWKRLVVVGPREERCREQARCKEDESAFCYHHDVLLLVVKVLLVYHIRLVASKPSCAGRAGAGGGEG